MKHGSLFSGIGGFDLAAEWMGWENIFHCEWNEFGQKVLKHYWPKATSYADITKTDFTIHRGQIDILTGGFPCQPYSLSGKRLGKEDDRHLWPEMLRAIREIQPSWIVGENVYGIINWNGGLVFNEVQAELEAEGYEIQTYVLPACAVNACHRRDRVWFVAHDTNRNANREESHLDGKINGRCKESKPKEFLQSKEHRFNGQSKMDRSKENGPYSDGIRQPRPGRPKYSISPKTERDWKEYRTFNALRWSIESPVCTGHNGIPQELDGITISKWREESLKAAGNAIVPQVAHQIFKAISEYESL